MGYFNILSKYSYNVSLYETVEVSLELLGSDLETISLSLFLTQAAPTDAHDKNTNTSYSR
jgi:hypothetical protein